MAKRTAREILDALEDEALDAEIEDALAMTPEERERELIAAGFTREELHAEAAAFLATLAPVPVPAVEPSASVAPVRAPAAVEPPAPSATPVPASPRVATPAPASPRVASSAAPHAIVLRPKWKRLPVVLPVAIALAAGVALVVELALPPPPLTARPPIDPARAASLRSEARDACNVHSWHTCGDKLDEAAQFDPQGDRAPDVQALRRTASQGERTP